MQQQFLQVTSQVAQWLRIQPTEETQETQVRSLGQKDPLEKEIAAHFIILAWKIPSREEPGGLQSMGSQKSGMWLSDWACTRTNVSWK